MHGSLVFTHVLSAPQRGPSLPEPPAMRSITSVWRHRTVLDAVLRARRFGRRAWFRSLAVGQTVSTPSFIKRQDNRT